MPKRRKSRSRSGNGDQSRHLPRSPQSNRQPLGPPKRRKRREKIQSITHSPRTRARLDRLVEIGAVHRTEYVLAGTISKRRADQLRDIERALAPFLPGPRSREVALFQAYRPSTKKGKARRARELERLSAFEPIEVQRLRRRGVELPFAILRTGSYQLTRAQRRGGLAPFQPARITAAPRFRRIAGVEILALDTEAGPRWLLTLADQARFARSPDATLARVVGFADSLGLREPIMAVRAGSYIQQMYFAPRDFAGHVQRLLLEYKNVPGHQPHKWFRGFVIVEGATHGGRA
jgi:hypothetical protein